MFYEATQPGARSQYLEDMSCRVAFVEDDQREELSHGLGLVFSLKQVVLVKTHEDKEINAFRIFTIINHKNCSELHYS